MEEAGRGGWKPCGGKQPRTGYEDCQGTSRCVAWITVLPHPPFMWVHAVRIVVLKFKVLPKVVTDTIYLFFSHVSTSQKCRACLYIYAFSLRVSCHVSTPTMHILAHVCHMSTSLQITLEGNLWTKGSSLDITAQPWYVHLPNMEYSWTVCLSQNKM